MLCLAGRAMAELAIKGLFSAQLVLDFAAVAACLVTGLEVLVLLVNSVWWTLLPLRDTLGALAS